MQFVFQDRHWMDGSREPRKLINWEFGIKRPNFETGLAALGSPKHRVDVATAPCPFPCLPGPASCPCVLPLLPAPATAPWHGMTGNTELLFNQFTDRMPSLPTPCACTGVSINANTMRLYTGRFHRCKAVHMCTGPEAREIVAKIAKNNKTSSTRHIVFLFNTFSSRYFDMQHL